MLVYCDIVSGDELVTDAYKMVLKDDAFYYIEAELRQYKSDDIDDSAIGGNKSAEDADDGVVDTESVSQINVVHDNRLVEVYFSDKKDFAKRNLKPFLASVKANKIKKGELKDDPDSIKAWEKGVNELLKKHILARFSDLQFFAGEGQSEEGALAYVDYIDNKPLVMLYKDGLKEVKQ